MKNKNLKEALRRLANEEMDSFAHAPTEELYYSTEYERKMERMLDHGSSRRGVWKRAGKQLLSFVLGAAIAVGVMLHVPYHPRKEDESVWRHDEVDFVDTQYTLTDLPSDVTIKSFGFEKDTYEYQYLTALCNLSYYAAIAKSYISRASYSYHEDSIVGGFLNYVSKDEICAPYDDILLYTYELLNTCGFAPAVLPYETIAEYPRDLSYERSEVCVTSFLGLSFGDIHTNLKKYANMLIALGTQYADYEGEFSLDDTVLEKARALVQACNVVSENQKKHLELWISYYDTIDPTLIVTEEFVSELDAVKITISGSGHYTVPALAERLIEETEDTEYTVYVNASGHMQVDYLPAKSLTIYMPVHAYFGEGAINRDLHIVKYGANDHYFYTDYPLTLDPAEYYSDQAITMNNAPLDAVLRGYFDGDYSERDLLCVQSASLYYVRLAEGYTTAPPELSLVVWDGQRYTTLTCSLDLEGAESTEAFVEALEEDLRHFHAFHSFHARYDAAEFVSEALIHELKPYYVNEKMDDLIDSMT